MTAGGITGMATAIEPRTGEMIAVGLRMAGGIPAIHLEGLMAGTAVARCGSLTRDGTRRLDAGPVGRVAPHRGGAGTKPLGMAGTGTETRQRW